MTLRRRTFLAGTALFLSGCASLSGSNDTTTATNSNSNSKTLDDFPAARGIDNQPTLGPQPGTADRTVIAFEDPSCHYCGRFERDTFPKIESNYIDSGKLSFVSRFAVAPIQPWGTPAAEALEATYARNESVFWTLKEHYFAEQDTFSESNVLSKTKSFLESNTDVDAAAVVDDAKNEAYEGALSKDQRAASAAGVEGVPSFFVFDGGTLSTSITGAQPYSVFEKALGE
ncbi:DsbA family protein [Haladaptatus sp. DYF46]|uniref:DsbA family protein n=1 Tax=Haladaptatus sp. DYF46 TaxID=2886041 RepID=UPI001E2CF5B2|nr:DsbA family protein [Haladaptatus sp. DYF46]